VSERCSAGEHHFYLQQCDGELEIGKDYYAKLTVSGKFIPG
jgi:hypothetical protein